jgi:hypothetical protein
MKSKLVPVLFIILVLLNGVLIFMLIKKPHHNRSQNQKKEKNFLTEQLEFTENQKVKFISLDEFHRGSMINLDHQIRKQKDTLFNSFGNKNINIDSLSQIIGKLEGKKEAEVFRFFKSVRKICIPKQQEVFDEIIKQAMKGRKRRPPEKGEMPPPR